jgi:signal peptidase I
MPTEPSWSHRFIVASLRAGRPAEVRLRGWSMAPALRDGDLLTVEPLGYVGRGPLVVGEVVVAERAEVLVAHRVVSVAADAVVTRGDAQTVDDPPLPRNEILGRVVRHRRAPWSRLRPTWLRLLRALGLNALY